MKRAIIRVIGLAVAFATIISTACGCRLIDSRELPRASKVPSSDLSSEAGSDLSSEASSATSSDTGYAKAPQLAEVVDSAHKYGNTAGNLGNEGLATIQGDWIYYATSTGIYKVPNNNSKAPVKICDVTWARYLNIWNGWLYFINYDDKFVYKVRTDGTGLKQFSLVEVSFLSICDGKAYCRYRTGKIVFSTGLDECTINTVVKKPTEDICIQNGKIFFSSGGLLYQTDLDGSNEVCYGDVFVQDLLIYKNRKYTTGNLTKSNYDDTDLVTLVPNAAFNINISMDWLYYTRDSEPYNHKLYKMTIYGEKQQLVCNEYCDNINLVGDWIFMLKGIPHPTDSSRIALDYFKMKTDGSELQRVD